MNPDSTQCASCGRVQHGDSTPVKSLLRCSRCKSVYYCDRDCQKNHWKEHKHACNTLNDQDSVDTISKNKSTSDMASIENSCQAEKETLSCSDKLKNSEIGNKHTKLNVPSQQFWEDDAVPLNLRFETSKGRIAIAKRDMLPGQILLAAEAYAITPVPSLRFRCCDYCAKSFDGPTTTTMNSSSPDQSTARPRCKDCKHTVFCSMRCAQAAAKLHAVECPALKELESVSHLFEFTEEKHAVASLVDTSMYSTGAGRMHMAGSSETCDGTNNRQRGNVSQDTLGGDYESALLTTKILCRKLAEQKFPEAFDLTKTPERGVYYRWRFDDFQDLVDHASTAPITDALYRTANTIYSAVEKAYQNCMSADSKQQITLPSIENVVQALLKVRYNAHPLFDAGQNRVGTGIFPAAAYLNHSCQPNAVVFASPEGRRVVVRSITKISAGDEVTYAYINTFFPRMERQNVLQNAYNFTCTCTVCQPPGCPITVSEAYACNQPNCPGPMLSIAQHDTTSKPCRCVQVCCTRDVAEQWLSQREKQSKLNNTSSAPLGRDDLRCLLCGSQQNAASVKGVLEYVQEALVNAHTSAASNPAGALHILETLSSSKPYHMLHRLHRLRLDVYLSAIPLGLQLGRTDVREESTRKALQLISTVTPREVIRAAWLGAAHTAAALAHRRYSREKLKSEKDVAGSELFAGGTSMQHPPGSIELCLDSAMRSYNTLRLVYGDEHPMVEKSQKLAWAVRDQALAERRQQ